MGHRHNLECVEAGTGRLTCSRGTPQCANFTTGCAFPAAGPSGLCSYCQAKKVNEAKRADKNAGGLPEAREYVKKIKNRAKQQYADAYLGRLAAGCNGEAPERPNNLSYMAAQAVRLHLGTKVG